MRDSAREKQSEAEATTPCQPTPRQKTDGLSRLTLYRAILHQSNGLARTRPSTHTIDHSFIRHTIRTRFRRDCNLQSPSQIANGLRAGYEALDLLYACTLHNADDNSNPAESSPLTRLTNLIASTRTLSSKLDTHRSRLLAERPPVSARSKRRFRHIERHSRKSAQIGRHGGNKKPVLERPLPLSEVRSGKRRVPQYVVTSSGVPFLRYGKPQPVALSRVLRQRMRKGEKLLEQKNGLDETRIWAEDEDWWDYNIGRIFGSQQEEGDERRKSKWTTLVDEMLQHNNQKFKEQTERNVEMGRKLWAVREKEKELALAEEIESRTKLNDEGYRNPNTASTYTPLVTKSTTVNSSISPTSALV